MDLVVERVVALGGELVDPVHIHGFDGVRLVHGEIAGPPVHLPGAGEDDLRPGIFPAATLEQGKLAAPVDLEVGHRIAHAVDVADLARQAEDQVTTLDEIPETVGIPDVGEVDVHPVRNPFQVFQPGAVLAKHRVHHHHLGTPRDESVDEIAPDESDAARDQDLATGVEISHAAAPVRPGSGRRTGGDRSGRGRPGPGTRRRRPESATALRRRT